MNSQLPFTPIAPEAGSERDSTLTRKLPLTRSLFGSSASTNDGMPMTVVEMSDIWIGMKGYGGRTMQISASTAAKTVLTRKSDAERWRLLMDRRPSATTSGMCAKSLSARTISETLRAAADPEGSAQLFFRGKAVANLNGVLLKIGAERFKNQLRRRFLLNCHHNYLPSALKL